MCAQRIEAHVDNCIAFPSTFSRTASYCASDSISLISLTELASAPPPLFLNNGKSVGDHL